MDGLTRWARGATFAASFGLLLVGCSSGPSSSSSPTDAGSTVGNADATVGADAATDSQSPGADAAVADAAIPDACAPAGTGAVGALGCPCSSPGQLGCNGNAQKVTLICSGGAWAYNQT